MQKRDSIINVQLLIGLTLSIAIHGAALYSKGLYVPAEPRVESGQTVVQLTLMPSLASQAAPPESVHHEPENEAPSDAVKESEPTAEPESVAVPEPAAVPRPTPATAPQPVTPAVQPAAVNAVEQEGSLLADKGVITEATATSSVKPSYPRISRLRGEEGVVTLSIEVLASGRTGKVEVLRSSGHRRLDEAACSAMRNASFTPAMQFGRAIDSTTELSITFELTDE